VRHEALTVAIASYVPWWAKIGAKLTLSRLPVPYGVWSRLGIFRHGDMADPVRAIGAFRTHLERARAVRAVPDGFTMLELGPGDSVLSAGVARALGGRESWLSDAGDFACRDPELFVALDAALSKEGLPSNNLPAGLSFEETLSRLNAHYLTGGVASLTAIPDRSVDLVWSSVVLEHVRRHEFPTLAAELARILTPNGMMSHAVDLRDHLGGSLNNLRFSHERWEHPSWRDAGFYTNRMSQAEIIETFARAGFKAVSVENDLWPGPPLQRTKMHPSFRGRSDAELSIAGFDVVLVRA
jgi:SAM-dependent methyltransferase